MWPAYALYAGDFEEWKEDVLWQATERVEKPLVISLQDFIKIDPVLFSLGISGLIFACIRRDYFIILFAFPVLAISVSRWVHKCRSYDGVDAGHLHLGCCTDRIFFE